MRTTAASQNAANKVTGANKAMSTLLYYRQSLYCQHFGYAAAVVRNVSLWRKGKKTHTDEGNKTRAEIRALPVRRGEEKRNRI